MLGGQNANQEILQSIRHDLGLDLPLMSRYALYLNDLSPVSVHNTSVQSSYIFLDDTKYTYLKLLDWSENRTLVLKYPYLRRSYSTDREVSDIIKSTLPDTAILAVASILIATIFGIVLGIFAALNRGSFFDNSLLAGARVETSVHTRWRKLTFTSLLASALLMASLAVYANCKRRLFFCLPKQL